MTRCAVTSAAEQVVGGRLWIAASPVRRGPWTPGLPRDRMTTPAGSYIKQPAIALSRQPECLLQLGWVVLAHSDAEVVRRDHQSIREIERLVQFA